MDHRYFPFFVDITGKKVLQVGAGNIALRRTESLLRFGADVTVTASEIRMEFLQLQQKAAGADPQSVYAWHDQRLRTGADRDRGRKSGSGSLGRV